MYAVHLCVLAGIEPVRDLVIASMGHLVTMEMAITRGVLEETRMQKGWKNQHIFMCVSI